MVTGRAFDGLSQAPRRRARTGILVLLLAIILPVFLVGSVLAFEWHYAERFYPGIWIWNVHVGGLLPEEAAAILEHDLGLETPKITLRGAGSEWVARPTDLGCRIDPLATLAPAYRVGRGSWWPDDLLTHLWLLSSRVEFPPVAVYDENVARVYLQTLAERIDVPPADARLSLADGTPVGQAAQAGRRLDVEATLATLFPAVSEFAPAEVALIVHDLPPAVVDADQARIEAEALLAESLTLVLATPRESDPGPWTLTPEQLVAMLLVWEENGVLHTKLDENALRAYLAGLAPSLAIEPLDAKLHFDERTRQLAPVSPSAVGRALDVEASATRILQELEAGNRFVPLIVQAVQPRYPDTALAEDLGIVELVAEGDSYFIGSSSARDHNIRLAASQFDGIIVPPGETFSFNYFLGEVSAEAGYDESYVTAGDQLAIEVGGGICQVSTTAFRAAFWGGYPIVERWYHNHRIGYYELQGAGVGMDATVYSPHVDFGFVNDRTVPLLIETEVVEGAHRLIFRFYSTGDGRRVEKEGPEISEETKPGPPIYELDEDLAQGAVVKWQSAVDGLTATVKRKVFDAQGGLLFEDTIISKYAPRRAAYHYGPGFEPPEQEAEPEE